jgi:hypothetical protein
MNADARSVWEPMECACVETVNLFALKDIQKRKRQAVNEKEPGILGGLVFFFFFFSDRGE